MTMIMIITIVMMILMIIFPPKCFPLTTYQFDIPSFPLHHLCMMITMIMVIIVIILIITIITMMVMIMIITIGIILMIMFPLLRRWFPHKTYQLNISSFLCTMLEYQMISILR